VRHCASSAALALQTGEEKCKKKKKNHTDNVAGMIPSHQLLGTHINADDSELNARLKRIRFLLHPDRHKTLSDADHMLLTTLTAAAADAAGALQRRRHRRADNRIESMMSQMRSLRCLTPGHAEPPPEADCIYECRVYMGRDDQVRRADCFLDGFPLAFDEWVPIHREAHCWAARAQPGQPERRRTPPGEEASSHGGHVPAPDSDASADKHHGEDTAQE
jgi:hypothetical protein